jgi:hypothetical protein
MHVPDPVAFTFSMRNLQKLLGTVGFAVTKAF